MFQVMSPVVARAAFPPPAGVPPPQHNHLQLPDMSPLDKLSFPLEGSRKVISQASGRWEGSTSDDGTCALKHPWRLMT